MSPLHFLPIAIIAAILIGFIIHDIRLAPVAIDEDDSFAALDTDPYIRLRVNDGQSSEREDDVFQGMPPATMRFGLVMVRERGKQPSGQKDSDRRLNYDKWGRTNNTIVRIDPRGEDDDGRDLLFGHVTPQQLGCRWIQMKTPLGEVKYKDKDGKEQTRLRDGYISVWEHETTRVRVTQTIEVVPGPLTNALDTCLVIYEIENRDTAEHQVGLRFMLDTFIGGNDGVPFLIPGRGKLCSTKEPFNKPNEVPDFIEAREKDSLDDPGTVALIQFKLGGRFEAPSRVFLGGWPDGNFKTYFGIPRARGQFTRWHVPEVEIFELQRRAQQRTGSSNTPPDSAVTMYWDTKPLKRDEKRTLAFTYGLGQNVSQSGGRMSLSFGGRLVRGGEFTVIAQVSNPTNGEKVTLTLPKGLELMEGTPEQAVPPVAPGSARPISAVTWRVKAMQDGAHELKVTSTSGAEETKKVKITAKGVFD